MVVGQTATGIERTDQPAARTQSRSNPVVRFKPLAKRLYGHVARFVPAPVKTRMKHARELQYWRECYENSTSRFDEATRRRDSDAYYRQLMLDVAGETDASFLDGKIVADFGCGPLGSLTWAKGAKLRIGIDVLADAYGRFNVAQHDMCYVCSTESAIPLPSGYVEVLYAVNALDHVADFEQMSRELLRILAPGGELIASFNLGEPPTLCEPQLLDERRVDRELLRHLDVTHYRVAKQGPAENVYQHFFDGSQPVSTGPRYLWVRAKKRAA